MSKQKFYLTTPIYYVNARPHIGHAYTTLVADTIARRHRLLGDDTFFLTGTDEHGQKIERSAAAAGIPPQQFADEVSAEFRNLWARMGLTNDDYIRTTEPRHQQGAQRLFALLHQRGQIYLSSYTGQYSVGEEIFVEGPPGVLGPDGRPTETVTEENFFFRLGDYQEKLINLIESDELHIQPESRKNEVLSFLRGPISAHLSAKAATDAAVTEAAAAKAEDADAAAIGNAAVLSALASSEATPFGALVSGEAALIAAIDIGQATEEAAHEAESPTPEPAGVNGDAAEANIAYSKLGKPYLKGALRDLSVSRSSFTWGIPVPEPAASETKQKHVIYVWLDALANYMTAVGYGSDDPEKIAQFKNYWPADLHIMAKEITRQHCIYWPAFLLAANLPLPKAVTAHGWLLFDDSKMSKSKGNIVRTETILDAFGTEVYAKQFPESTKHEQDLFAADVLRYFLLREVPFGQDGSFSFEAMITRYNAELVNGYGNLVSRVLTLINQSQEGLIPDHADWPTAVMQILEKKLRRGSIGHPTDFGPFVETTDIDLARLAAAVCRFYDLTISRLHFSLGMKEELAEAIKEQKRENNGEYAPVAGGEFGALDYVWLLIGKTDEFLSSTTPWKLAKQQDEHSQSELRDVLYIASESIRIITALLYPIAPYAASRVWSQLGLEDIELAAKERKLILTTGLVSRDEQPAKFSWGSLPSGTKLGPLSPIFPRADKGLAQIMTDIEANNTPKPTPSKFVDERTVNTEPSSADTTDPGAAPRTGAIDEPNSGATVGGSRAIIAERPANVSHTEAPASGPFAAAAAASPTPDTPQIAIDDFVKIDLRVAQIIVAERIPKADKLLRLEVDLGYEKRQILSGIAEWYTPEELLGRRIVVIANLAPRKMRGLDSHGMLLAASNGENGKPILATFAEDIALGSRLR
jgi:methionyl-tRNA synthetase